MLLRRIVLAVVLLAALVGGPRVDAQVVGAGVGQTGTVTANDGACWSSAGVIKDCGLVPGAGTVTGPATSTTGDLLSFNGTTGKVLQDSGVLASTVVVGPASATTGDIATYNGTTGKLVQDSGVLASSVVVGPASVTSGNIATYNGTTGKIVQDSGSGLLGQTSYSPTMTCGAGSIGAPSRQHGNYGTLGKFVFVSVDVQFAAGTCSGTVSISLPLTANSGQQQALTAIDNTTNLPMDGLLAGSATTVSLFTSVGGNPTVTDNFVISGMYQQ
jgi:hypothetical protein